MTELLRKWTFVILWVFTLTISWEAAVEELPWVGTLSRAVGLVAVPIAVMAVIAGGRRHRVLDTHLIMALLVVWGVASLAWTIDPEITILAAGTSFQLLAMVLLLWEFGRDGNRRRLLLWALVLGALAGAVAVFPQAVSGDPVTTRYARTSQGGLNANYAAFVFSLAIPVAWHLCITTHRAFQRWVAGLCVPALAVAAVITGSRGGLLTLFLALTILPLSLHRVGLRSKIFALIGLAVSIVLVTQFVPAQTIDRFETIPGEVTGGDFGARRQVWEVSWRIFSEDPILGVGAGASRVRIEPFIGREQGPHNTYLSLAGDLGVVGLGLFLLLLMSVSSRWSRMRGRERQLVGVLLLTLVIGLIPGHWESHKATWLIIAIMLAETELIPMRNAALMQIRSRHHAAQAWKTEAHPVGVG